MTTAQTDDRRSPTGAATITAAWNRFFFTPADPRSLGLIRIGVGLLLIWSFVWLGVDLPSALGSLAWADPKAVRHLLPPGAWSFWLLLDDAWIRPAWIIGLIIMCLFTLGIGTRITAVLAWAFAVSTMRRAPTMLFGFDTVLATWAFYLAVCGASGQALAIRPRHHTHAIPRRTVSANLGLRLIQLHLCLIYASAGLAKLQGRPWWDGSALGMLLGNSEFRTFDLSFLADHPRWLELGTHATVWLELLYPVFVWFRGWRMIMVAAAILMHLGIALAMGLTEFSLAMIVANLAFIRPEWLDLIARRLVRAPAVAVGGSGS